MDPTPEPPAPPEPSPLQETPLSLSTPGASRVDAPPIPPPTPYYCPNCGVSLSGPVELCPRCGARLAQQRAGVGVGNIIGAIALGLVAVPLGISGSCFALFGVGSLRDASGLGAGAGLIAVALFLLAAAALCIFGIVKVLKRK